MRELGYIVAACLAIFMIKYVLDSTYLAGYVDARQEIRDAGGQAYLTLTAK